LTPEGQQFFKENNFRDIKCALYVHDASELAEAMLMKD
jgi:hypothetical protein